MADMVALGSAVYAALDAATALTVYNGMATQGGSAPYVVFSRQSAVDGYSFSSESVSADYLVKVVGTAMWPTQLYATYETVHSGFQDNLGSVAGYTALRCRRTNTLEYRDPDGYWHVGGIYRIDIET